MRPLRKGGREETTLRRIAEAGEHITLNELRDRHPSEARSLRTRINELKADGLIKRVARATYACTPKGQAALESATPTLKARLLDHIKRNPGTTADQIRATLGLTLHQAQIGVARLVSERVVERIGDGRVALATKDPEVATAVPRPEPLPPVVLPLAISSKDLERSGVGRLSLQPVSSKSVGRVMRWLRKRQRGTGSQIAKGAGLPVGETYDCLDELLREGRVHEDADTDVWTLIDGDRYGLDP